VYKYLMVGRENKGAKLFSGVPSDKTRGAGHSYKQLKFHLKSRKYFLFLRVVRPWKRLPREAAESPSMEGFEIHLDKVLSTLL